MISAPELPSLPGQMFDPSKSIGSIKGPRPDEVGKKKQTRLERLQTWKSASLLNKTPFEKKNRNKHHLPKYVARSQMRWINHPSWYILAWFQALQTETFEALTQCRTIHQHPTTLFPRDKDGSRSIYLPQHLRSYHLICLRKNMNWTIQQATNVFQILHWQYDKWITRDSKM